MRAVELAERVGARYPDAACVGDGPASVRVDVPVVDWVAAATFARDQLGCGYFDWLAAVDEQDAGLAVVLHVWSVAERHHVFLRTQVPRERPELPTLTGVYRGASWHEREAAEMFGLVFAGHPDPRPLLLPDGFEGHPLRKDFVLASRAVKSWPGAKGPR